MSKPTEHKTVQARISAKPSPHFPALQQAELKIHDPKIYELMQQIWNPNTAKK